MAARTNQWVGATFTPTILCERICSDNR
jgi:hypothetical protein